jgi:thiamine pyrophosphate-dependent acetolactate synthase large subunit-like protein
MGTGHYNGLPAIHVGVDDPLDLILPWSLGAVGTALPTAIGAAIARPDQTTVVFEGDGGLMMCRTELDTAVRARCSSSCSTTARTARRRTCCARTASTRR